MYVVNQVLYSEGPSAANASGKAMLVQSTGRQNLTGVNAASVMISENLVPRVEAAGQNTQLALGFLGGVQTNLGTALESLTEMAAGMMTLSNGVVPSAQKAAAVNKIVEGLGMKPSPQNRMEKEGAVIASLRQAGMGQALYSKTTTTFGAAIQAGDGAFATSDGKDVKPEALKQDASGTNKTKVTFGDAFSANSAVKPEASYTRTSDATDQTITFEVRWGDKTYSFSEKEANGGDVIAADGELKLTNAAGDSADTIEFTIGSNAVTDNDTAKAVADELNRVFAGELTYISASPGFVGFSFNEDVVYGAGAFTLGYDGQNLEVKDEFGTSVASYPVPPEQLWEAQALAEKTGQAQPVSIGSIGTLRVDADLPTSIAELAATPDMSLSTTTKDFEASVTVSGTGGERHIQLPDLTNPLSFWGDTEEIDVARLRTDADYQKEIGGRIAHATTLVQATLQDVSNYVQTLERDKAANDKSLETLKNQVSIVADADPARAARDVFENGQRQQRLMASLTLASQNEAKILVGANQIAQLGG